MDTDIIQTTSFGRFKGIRKNGIVKYLGIKYASLEDRLAVPVMVEDYGDQIIDCTKFGPRTIGAAEECSRHQKNVIQQTIDTPDAPPMSDCECLNLNITIIDWEGPVNPYKRVHPPPSEPDITMDSDFAWSDSETDEDMETDPDIETVPDVETGPDIERGPDIETGPDTTMHPEIETGPDTTMQPDIETGPDTTMHPDIETGPDTTMHPGITMDPDIPRKTYPKPTKPIPVVVFVNCGGNWWPQYDQVRLVELSAQVGCPIIGIHFNYRSGVLGNLTSADLRKKGYLGNNTFRDQKCAFRWVKSHIKEFGGNPRAVTAIGASEGAVSVLNLLFSKEPLFARAVSMSGTPIAYRPINLPVMEELYDHVIKELGLQGASVDERVDRLLTISADEFVAKKKNFEVNPWPLAVVDGYVIPDTKHFTGYDMETLSKRVPGHSWCSELMIGNNQDDALQYGRIVEEKWKNFSTSLIANLHGFTACKILEAYQIRGVSDDSDKKNIINFATDVKYFGPALAFADSWPGWVFQYILTEKNPWDGEFKGRSSHMLDSVFLFQNYNEKLPAQACEFAMGMAKGIIAYAYGGRPWQRPDFSPLVKLDDVHCYGPLDEFELVRARIQRLANIVGKGSYTNLYELCAAWDSFLYT